MITSAMQAAEVQRRRREQGKCGRSKAVRRWFKREYGGAVEAHGVTIMVETPFGTGISPSRRNLQLQDLRKLLRGNFENCRRFDEVYS